MDFPPARRGPSPAVARATAGAPGAAARLAAMPRANARWATTPARTAAIPPMTSPARGPAVLESQPAIGPPIGVEPMNTTE